MNIKQFFQILTFNILALQGICMAREYPGMLCAIEGLDGAGKTTLLQKLEQKFASTEIKAIFTKEPGATQLGKYLRKLLNERTITIGTLAEFLLFAADRAEHFEKDIIPSLKQGHLIISDRMADSSIAYQGYLKGLDISMIKTVNTWCMQNITPDITIYLRITPDQAKQRILQSRGFATAFEEEYIDRLQVLFDGFEQIFANKQNAIIIDATQDAEIIAQQVFEVLQQKITDTQHATT